MTITALRLYRFSLPLMKPLVLRGVTLSERDGLLVKLADENGTEAWGEVSPLPGFSAETRDQAEAQLLSAATQLCDHPAPENLENLDGGFEQWLGAMNLYPSVRHGLETAVLALLANRAGKSMARLLHPEPASTFRINGFIAGSAAEVTAQARQLQRDGYRAVKVKVGRGTVAEDIDRTRNVFHELDSRCHLRLDANRVWTVEQAKEFFDGIRDCEIEYIEDPVSTLSDLRRLLADGCPPVAIDEFLTEIEPDDLAGVGAIAAIILKPTLLGGFERSAHFARAAKALKIHAVVSSSFESPLGLAALGPLVTACGSPGVPVGLDTAGWFGINLLREPILSGGGVMRVEQLARAALSLDTSHLTEVPQ